jgi:hypothetical protein
MAETKGEPVEFIRELDGFTGDACLVKRDGKHYVVSTTYAFGTGLETLIFPADAAAVAEGSDVAPPSLTSRRVARTSGRTSDKGLHGAVAAIRKTKALGSRAHPGNAHSRYLAIRRGLWGRYRGRARSGQCCGGFGTIHSGRPSQRRSGVAACTIGDEGGPLPLAIDKRCLL